MKIEFCLPVYNEEKIIADSIQKLYSFLMSQDFAFEWKIVVVINGSSDSSLAIAQGFSEKFPGKISVENFARPGRGQALKSYWLKSPADIFVYMDIDLAVSLECIPPLIHPLLNNSHQVAVGSRLLPDSQIARSFIREFSSRIYNFLARLIMGHRLSDMQCGFKAITRPAFLKIAPYLNDNHWFLDTEIIIISRAAGYHIKEIAVNWQENRYDKRKTKVKLIRDSWKMFKKLIKLRTRLPKITQNLKNIPPPSI